ncbi:MAG: multicopper oxidase domain-containing protein [Rhizobiaceae bacterium]
MAPFRHVTRIAMRGYGFPGPYVVHCHLLDHEDNDMMRPIRVIDPDDLWPLWEAGNQHRRQ